MKYKVQDVVFKMISQLTDSNAVLVVGVDPYYAYVNGVRSDQIAGYRYTIVAQKKRYLSFYVKTEESAPSITQEMIEAAGGAIVAEPLSFEAKFYRTSTGEYELTARASKFVVVEED